MPAKLVVMSGPATGQIYWVEDEVVRLGADPALEICLAGSDLPAHAATLEYSDRAYTLYNRSGVALALGGVLVAPRGSATWRHGQHLVLGPELSLRLDLDGDPAPVRQVRAPSYQIEEVLEEEEGEPEALPPTPGWASSKAVQIGVILACIAGIAYIVATDKGDQQPGSLSPEAVTASFRDLVTGLAETQDEEHHSLLAQVQAARIAENRGETSQAKQFYGKIYATLAPRKGGDGFAEGIDRKLWDFVVERLTGELPSDRPPGKADAG